MSGFERFVTIPGCGSMAVTSRRDHAFRSFVSIEQLGDLIALTLYCKLSKWTLVLRFREFFPEIFTIEAFDTAV